MDNPLKMLNECPKFCVDGEPSDRKSDIFLEDWLFYLAKENSKAQNEANDFRDNLCAKGVVEFLFNITRAFSVEKIKEVQFLAVEIFDRFLFHHVAELRSHVNGNKSHVWDKVQNRITNQLLLRACSSVQIASKIIYHKSFVTGDMVQKWLEKRGYYYKLDNLMSSEMRVMKTLNYKIDILTPLTYVESLLEIISHQNSNIKPSNIYQASVFCLEIFYLNRNDIYEDLFRNHFSKNRENSLTESVTTPMKSNKSLEISETGEYFRKVKSDYMLLASAILTVAAGYISKTTQNMVGNKVAEVTRFPLWCIEQFAEIIEKYVNPRKV